MEILDAFTPGHISVSVEVFSGKSANLLYYILNYGSDAPNSLTAGEAKFAV